MKPVWRTCSGSAGRMVTHVQGVVIGDAVSTVPRLLFQCSACKYQVSVTAGTIFHKTRTPLVKWFWMIFMMARQKSGVSMLSLQRMLGIRSYKTVWTMGHKIRKAMEDWDSQYQLAGLVEMDDAFIGPRKPGPPGRRAIGKSKVVIAVESQRQAHGIRCDGSSSSR